MLHIIRQELDMVIVLGLLVNSYSRQCVLWRENHQCQDGSYLLTQHFFSLKDLSKPIYWESYTYGFPQQHRGPHCTQSQWSKVFCCHTTRAQSWTLSSGRTSSLSYCSVAHVLLLWIASYRSYLAFSWQDATYLGTWHAHKDTLNPSKLNNFCLQC